MLKHRKLDQLLQELSGSSEAVEERSCMCERCLEEGEPPACAPGAKLRPFQSCRGERVPRVSVICPAGCGRTVVPLLCDEVVVVLALWGTSRASEGWVDLNSFLVCSARSCHVLL